jgi:uncharacterized membrane-anchored protein YjiN (DUF445 family)
MSPPPRLPGERRVALCVKQWSSDASLVTWAFVKNWFLRVSVEKRLKKDEISTNQRFEKNKTLEKISLDLALDLALDPDSKKKKKILKKPLLLRNAAPRTAPTRSPRSTGSTSST